MYPVGYLHYMAVAYLIQFIIVTIIECVIQNTELWLLLN
jgi:hypothetical protein